MCAGDESSWPAPHRSSQRVVHPRREAIAIGKENSNENTLLPLLGREKDTFMSIQFHKYTNALPWNYTKVVIFGGVIRRHWCIENEKIEPTKTSGRSENEAGETEVGGY